MKRSNLVVTSLFCRYPRKTLRLCDFGVLFLFFIVTLLPHTMAGKEELYAVIQGNGMFTRQLYSVLSRQAGNVFFSPISAHAVLAMAYQGANGSTKEAFTKALSVPDSNHAAEGYKDVMGHLNNLPDVQLLIANKIYLMQGFNLKSTFKEVVEKKFLSEVETTDFANSQESAAKINGWVESKTQNKIKDLISADSLGGSTRLVLVNAIYFKGNWATKFDKAQTKIEKFYLNDNDSVDVQMMNTKSKFAFKEDSSLDAKVLELPYVNRDVSLIIILPNKRNGIAELEAKLANADLSKITEGMYKAEVMVKLPKFKFETTIDLKESLAEIGLGEIFDETKANFSGILAEEKELYVSKVIQKAFIEVNEEGTEAAAATAMIMCLMAAVSVPPPLPQEFIADHPFVIMLTTRGSIVDQEREARLFFDNIVLFQGRVSRPNI